MHALLEPLWQSPRLPEILEEANRLWAEEQVRRARFIAELTPEIKAEFIDGQVVLHSPATAEHMDATGNLYLMLRAWAGPGHRGRFFVEKALVRTERHDFEPDLVYFAPVRAAEVVRGKMIFGMPDFVVEVLSESTAARDRGVKLDTYREFGAVEYWIVDTERQEVTQYVRTGGTLRLGGVFGAGQRLNSPVFVGLDLPVAAIFQNDAALAFAELQAVRRKP